MGEKERERESYLTLVREGFVFCRDGVPNLSGGKTSWQLWSIRLALSETWPYITSRKSLRRSSATERSRRVFVDLLAERNVGFTLAIITRLPPADFLHKLQELTTWRNRLTRSITSLMRSQDRANSKISNEWLYWRHLRRKRIAREQVHDCDPWSLRILTAVLRANRPARFWCPGEPKNPAASRPRDRRFSRNQSRTSFLRSIERSRLLLGQAKKNEGKLARGTRGTARHKCIPDSGKGWSCQEVNIASRRWPDIVCKVSHDSPWETSTSPSS